MIWRGQALLEVQQLTVGAVIEHLYPPGPKVHLDASTQLRASSRPKPDAPGRHNRQSSGQPANHALLVKEAFDEGQDERRVGIRGQLQDNQTMVAVGRVVPDVRKTEVASQQDGLVFECAAGDGGVFRAAEPEVADIHRFMAEPLHQRLGGTRQISIEHEAHDQAGQAGRGWWVS